MPETRRIRKVLKSKATIEGAGVHLKRAFGFREVPTFDPFLLLDDFHSDNPQDYEMGFPWHPHRGIETITYVLNGKVEHGDSLGNQGVISSGDVQWMTAGSGIIHQEMPKDNSQKLMWGFQLWANLPASQKMMEPRYRDVTSDQIPEVTLESGVRIKIVSGKVKDTVGPVRDVVIEPEYLDVTIPPRSQYLHPVKQGLTALAYVISGQGLFCDEKDPFTYEVEGDNYFDMDAKPELDAENLLLFGDGNQIVVSTKEKEVRFLLVSGKPLREPVAWYGPIVMNTQEELRRAFAEYHEGTFIKNSTT